MAGSEEGRPNVMFAKQRKQARRADLGTDVAGRIADAVGTGRYDKAISADDVPSRTTVAVVAAAEATA